MGMSSGVVFAFLLFHYQSSVVVQTHTRTTDRFGQVVGDTGAVYRVPADISSHSVITSFVHDVFTGKRTDAPRRRHNRLPVKVSCRYRTTASAAFVASNVTEIGVGGALLETKAPLALDTELTLEITPPGAAAPLAIASRVSYHGPSGNTGLRFVTRDGDGDRRLRELIRRLRAS